MNPLEHLGRAKSFLYRAQNADSLRAKEGHLRMAALELERALKVVLRDGDTLDLFEV